MRKRSRVKRATNLGEKSSLLKKLISQNFLLQATHLKTVKARQVSVTAYQLRSIKCSNSAALNWPKNNFLINLPVKITRTRDCKKKLKNTSLSSVIPPGGR